MRKMRILAAILAVLAAVAWACGPRAAAPNDTALEAQARALHDRILSVDTHTDTAMRMTNPNFDVGQRHEPGQPGSGLVDLPRMVDGCLDALFFGCFVGQGPLTPEGYDNARTRVLAMIDAVHKMTEKYPNLVGLATTPADAYRLKKDGKRIAFIGMENGYPVGTDLGRLEEYAKLGDRYLTLCHSSDNQICDSSTDRRDPEDRGLSDFGRQVVAECNRLGIMIDVSHMSDKSFFDVIAASNAPIFASHSCCRALCDNPRNLTDEMIKALAKHGGVLQMCFLGAYLKAPEANPERDQALKELEAKYGTRQAVRNIQDADLRAKAQEEYMAVMRKYPESRASVKDVVDHIDHIIQLVGDDYAGIGTDFDGGGGVSDCSDVSQMYRVTMEMLRRGYSEKRIEKIWGGNIMRVLQKVIDVAAASN
jgi:membrane dipeptidase